MNGAESTDIQGYDHQGNLIQTIGAFAQALRRDGTGTTILQTITALNGLRLISIRNKADLRYLLRSTLISRPEDLDVFDYHFHYFFNRLDRTPPAGPQTSPIPADGTRRPYGSFLSEPAKPDETTTPLPARASLEKCFGKMDFARTPSEEIEGMERLVRQMALKLAHRIKQRLKRTGKAEELHFRGILRASLQYGGEPIRLKYRNPKPRPPRLLIFGDVSGSMEAYTRFFLVFLASLSKVLPRCEIFLFSTTLARITRELGRFQWDTVRKRLTRLELPLSGGTDIGGCLTEFYRQYGDTMLSPATHVLIISDGWDRGDPRKLDRVLGQINRRCGGIIWLNPLASDPGYEPLARGMATALPHLKALSSFGCPADIPGLGKVLEDVALGRRVSLSGRFSRGARPYS